MSNRSSILLRTEPKLRETLRKEAKRRGVSINQLCNDFLSSSFQAKGDPNPLVGQVLAAFENQLEGIVLFGSVARRDETEASDIDLLLVLKPGLAVERHLYDQWDDQLKSLDSRVSPHFVSLSPQEESGGLWFEVAVDGQILWDASGKVAKVLQDLRGIMAEGKIQRKWSHGHPYWVRVE